MAATWADIETKTLVAADCIIKIANTYNGMVEARNHRDHSPFLFMQQWCECFVRDSLELALLVVACQTQSDGGCPSFDECPQMVNAFLRRTKSHPMFHEKARIVRTIVRVQKLLALLEGCFTVLVHIDIVI